MEAIVYVFLSDPLKGFLRDLQMLTNINPMNKSLAVETRKEREKD